MTSCSTAFRASLERPENRCSLFNLDEFEMSRCFGETAESNIC